METIIIIILCYFGYVIFFQILGAAGRAAKAAGKTALGKGTMRENMDLEFKGMGPMQVQIIEVDKDNDSPFFLEVQVKGLIPIYSMTNAGFIVSVLSNDDEDELAPVLSMIDSFEEPTTRAFQNVTGIGEVGTDQGWISWVRIGVVPPEILIPPVGGRQELTIVVRLVDMDNLPNIEMGFGKGELWLNTVKYSYSFDIKGYKEEAENRDQARALSIKIGMAVAMADGELDKAEGNSIKDWIKNIIAPFGEEKQEELKKIYNESLRDSYNLADSGKLILSDICKEMNEIADKVQKNEALELAHRVMAADGVVHKDEMKVINNVASSLDIDPNDLAKIRDQQIVALDVSTDDVDLDSLLGIDSSWSNDEIKLHLTNEFKKWNNRLNTLSEGSERENAQQMLDLIAEARKKYA